MASSSGELPAGVTRAVHDAMDSELDRVRSSEQQRSSSAIFAPWKGVETVSSFEGVVHSRASWSCTLEDGVEPASMVPINRDGQCPHDCSVCGWQKCCLEQAHEMNDNTCCICEAGRTSDCRAIPQPCRPAPTRPPLVRPEPVELGEKGLPAGHARVRTGIEKSFGFGL